MAAHKIVPARLDFFVLGGGGSWSERSKAWWQHKLVQSAFTSNLTVNGDYTTTHMYAHCCCAAKARSFPRRYWLSCVFSTSSSSFSVLTTTRKRSQGSIIPSHKFGCFYHHPAELRAAQRTRQHHQKGHIFPRTPKALHAPKGVSCEKKK